MDRRASICTRFALCILLLLAFAIVPAGAQPLPAEQRVAFDAEGRVLEVGPRARGAFATFGWDRTDFRRALLWAAADSTWILDAEFERDGVRSRERMVLDGAAVERMRADVLRALRSGGASPQGARALLGLGTLALGFGFYSWAIPVATEAVNDAAAGALSVAGSLLLPYVITDRAYVSWGDANLALYGGTRGIAYGVLARDLVVGDRESHDRDGQLRAAVAGSLASEIGGFLWAHSGGMSAGHARLVGLGGDVGLLWGIALSEIADGDDGTGRDDERRHNGAAGLAGAALGLGAGHVLARRGSPQWGNTGAVRTAGMIGALVGVSFVDMDDGGSPSDDADNVNAGLAAMVAGSAGGLVLGSRVVRDRDIGVSHAILIDVMTGAGAVTGLAVASLAGGDSDDSRLYTGAAALGALGGYGIGLRASRFRGGRAAAGPPRSPWRWDASGLALAALGWNDAPAAPWLEVDRRF